MKTRANLMMERAGVNYARNIAEGAGCLFKEINLQHDYGHDATIMLVVDGFVQPKEVALQIKSGSSYIVDDVCQLPATIDHIKFWAKHDLTTLGVVYDPKEGQAYWLDLQAASRDHGKKSGTTFKFPKSLWNRFDAEQFPTVILPTLLGEAPTVPLVDLIEWVRSDDLETHDLGVRAIRARHYKVAEAWGCLISEFQARPAEKITASLGIALAKLLGHDDIGYYDNEIPDEVRRPAMDRVLEFGPSEIAKALNLVHDGDFDRPSIGYSLLPLFGGSARSMSVLAAVRDDPRLKPTIREYAAEIIRHHDIDPDWWQFWRRDKSHDDKRVQ